MTRIWTALLASKPSGYKLGLLLALSVLLAYSPRSWAQETILVRDSLDTRPKGKDLTELLLWRGLSAPESGFVNALRTDTSGLAFTGIRLSDSAARYSQFTRSDGLKTNTALDYRFNYRIDRLTDTLVVEFDLLHDAVNNSGEAGRMVISLLHDYPANGPQWRDVDSVNKYHPFGRPAYNVRIMNKNQTPNNNLAGVMLYGGGHVRKGEMEIFRRNNDTWWLTGFSTEAGGFSPGSNGEYPRSGSASLRNTGMTSATRWAHFTWRIFPDRLELWRRWSNQTPQNDQLGIRMVVPQVDTLNPGPTLAALNQAYGTNLTSLPRLYWWFRHPEAFRIYWAGGVNATVANLKVKAMGPGVVTHQERNTDISKLDFTVWPNPVTEIINIRLSSLAGPTTVWLIDLTGKVHHQGNVETSTYTIGCKDLPRGVYFIKSENSHSCAIRRLILK